MNPRFSKLDGGIDDLVFCLSIPLAEPVGCPVLAKGAIIPAPRGKVDESIQEGLVAKISVLQPSGNLEKALLLPFVLQGQKRKDLFSRERVLSDGFV